MTRTGFRIGLLLVAAVVSSSLVGREEPPLTGVVSGEGFTRIKIAIPAPAADTASSAVALEIAQTVRADLIFSGYFDVLDPALYGLVRGDTGSKVPHAEWLSIGADAVVLSTLRLQGSRLDLQARLHDNPSGTVPLVRRYGGELDLARRVAHQLSDDLVQHYTGRPGVAMTRIAFVSKHGKGMEIYLMDYDGRRLRRLTTTDTINLAPTWAPDGERLAFVSWRGGSPEVHVFESDGRLVRAATAGGEMNSSPDWSPDGRRLVYTSDADGNSEIYVLDLAKGRNTRLTR